MTKRKRLSSNRKIKKAVRSEELAPMEAMEQLAKKTAKRFAGQFGQLPPQNRNGLAVIMLAPLKEAITPQRFTDRVYGLAGARIAELADEMVKSSSRSTLADLRDELEQGFEALNEMIGDDGEKKVLTDFLD